MELNKVNWNELRDRAYQNAVNHGWYNKEVDVYNELMLIITELSEAVNADRKESFSNIIAFQQNCDTPQENQEEHFVHCYDLLMKDTVEDELADAFIRMLSFMGATKSDFDARFFGELPINTMVNFMINKSFTGQVYSIVYSVIIESDLMCAMNRVLSLAIIHDIDLVWHIEQKMNYNELRPYKHGKKY